MIHNQKDRRVTNQLEYNILIFVFFVSCLYRQGPALTTSIVTPDKMKFAVPLALLGL